MKIKFKNNSFEINDGTLIDIVFALLIFGAFTIPHIIKYFTY